MPIAKPSLRARIRAAVYLPLIAGTALTGTATAQQQDRKPAELDTVTIRGISESGYQPTRNSSALRTDAPLLEIPQAVNVVTEDVLLDQDARSLDDALQNISGISQTNTLGSTQDAFIRRGFGDNRDGGILTNGLKTVLPRSFNATTQRVEVLKGPASTLYGILDPGGAINVITKKPERQFSGKASVSASSFGGGTTSLDVTGPITDTRLAYRLVADYQNTDYWRNFGKTKEWLIAPSLSWFGDDTVVTASYMYQDYSIPFDRGTIWDIDAGGPIPLSRKTRLDEPFNVTQGSSQLASINIFHTLNDDWNLTFDYSYSRDEYSDNQARVQGYDAVTGDVTRRIDATQGSKVSGHSMRVDLAGSLDIAGLKNDLLVGAQYDYQHLLRTDMIRCTPAVSFNIYNPTYGTVSPCTTVRPAESDQLERLRTPSVYLQDSLHLNDRWILVAGARYQYYDQISGRGRPFVLNTDTSGGKFVPRLGAVYKASPAMSFYANAARTFRPQSSFSSYFGDLTPEEGTSYELGAKWESAGGMSANLAIYTTDKKNVSYFETVDGVIVTRTAGLVRARGLEFDVAGRLTPQLSLIASYGFTDAKVKDDPDYAGKRPVNIARHTASLFATYDFGAQAGGNRFKLGAGVRGASKRAGINDNSYFLPGYGVVDAFASYTIAARHPITLQLNLRNLFDRTYFSSSLGASRYGNAYGEPFNATLTASVSF
ncbi:TonB-dependent siderophore receptor [Corticibacter populi]|nr:TonB-dependent siderophore receptor [Corticibacter populi]RZS31061.1 iron complex outermembrane receptor protein [Corticibacter populi]